MLLGTALRKRSAECVALFIHPKFKTLPDLITDSFFKPQRINTSDIVVTLNCVVTITLVQNHPDTMQSTRHSGVALVKSTSVGVTNRQLEATERH